MSPETASKERRTEKLDLRVSRSAKSKLQAAAVATHRSMSDFVMDSALAHAEQTLAERRTFGLNAKEWSAFQAALDAPTQALPRMHTLLSQPGFFDPPASHPTNAE